MRNELRNPMVPLASSVGQIELPEILFFVYDLWLHNLA